MNTQIEAKDIAINTYDPKPGNWNVPKLTGIQIIHLPTGTVVSCDASDSVHLNKERAMVMLQIRVEEAYKLKEEENQALYRRTLYKVVRMLQSCEPNLNTQECVEKIINMMINITTPTSQRSLKLDPTRKLIPDVDTQTANMRNRRAIYQESSMTDRYTDLRTALEMKPTKGPWKVELQKGAAHSTHGVTDGWKINGPDYIPDWEDTFFNKADAYYIATCNPVTITALLADYDRMRDALCRLEKSFKAGRDNANAMFYESGSPYHDGRRIAYDQAAYDVHTVLAQEQHHDNQD